MRNYKIQNLLSVGPSYCRLEVYTCMVPFFLHNRKALVLRPWKQWAYAIGENSRFFYTPTFNSPTPQKLK